MNGVTKLTHAKAILVAHLSENIRKQGIQELIEHLWISQNGSLIPDESRLWTGRISFVGIWMCTNIWSLYSSWNFRKLAPTSEIKAWSMWLTQWLHRIVYDSWPSIFVLYWMIDRENRFKTSKRYEKDQCQKRRRGRCGSSSKCSCGSTSIWKNDMCWSRANWWWTSPRMLL